MSTRSGWSESTPLSSTATIVVEVGTAASGAIINEAEVSADETETDTADNTALESTVVDELLSSIEGFVYVDLDDCIEWNRHVYHAAPQAMTWWHGPGPRHELESAGVGGLLLASQTLEIAPTTQAERLF